MLDHNKFDLCILKISSSTSSTKYSNFTTKRTTKTHTLTFTKAPTMEHRQVPRCRPGIKIMILSRVILFKYSKTFTQVISISTQYLNKIRDRIPKHNQCNPITAGRWCHLFKVDSTQLLALLPTKVSKNPITHKQYQFCKSQLINLMAKPQRRRRRTNIRKILINYKNRHKRQEPSFTHIPRRHT